VKLTVRRVGNSYGVIIPKRALKAWGLGEGDALELTENGIRPPSRGQEVLDRIKRQLAIQVATRYPPRQIRAHSLANLHRWRRAGVWVPAYDVWKQILEDGSDGELYATLLGFEAHANELRQSPPYVGLLPPEVVQRVNDETAA
jgi:antitoxin component of MazEF toxin-antitoxin module